MGRPARHDYCALVTEGCAVGWQRARLGRGSPAASVLSSLNVPHPQSRLFAAEIGSMSNGVDLLGLTGGASWHERFSAQGSSSRR
jgi:hypothetical protein